LKHFEVIVNYSINHQSSDAEFMRTTLDIDEDVLLAVKELSKRNKKSAGEVLSELARFALTNSTIQVGETVTEYGFPTLPKKTDAVVTAEHINRLMEESDL